MSTKKISIEDAAEDVIAKAQSGLGLSDGELAEQTGCDRAAIRALRKGEFDADTARKIAPALGLGAKALVALGEHAWYPEPLSVPGLLQVNTPHPVPGYAEMTVNAYLVTDPATGQCAVFDSGADASELLAAIEAAKGELAAVFLTHAHRDHVKDLDRLRDALVPGGQVFAHPDEEVARSVPLHEGERFALGGLKLTAHVTSGHSPGGTSFVIEGLARPVAIVGDALFASSIGGVRENYRQALQMIREHLLGLPGDTILCPGHGPLTTVANELRHNPFFAG